MPSKTCVRRRVPSTTWKCTRTRSPAWKDGTRRSCARSMLSMTPDIGTKNATAGSRRAWTEHGSEGDPEPSPAAARAALLEPPFADPRVVARQQHLRHLVPAPVERARVVRVLGRPLERLAERLLHRALLVAERARQLADHRVGHHHRRQLAARQHVRPDRHHVGGEVLVHALVEALVAPESSVSAGSAGQLGGERVVELAPGRRQRDRPVRRRRLARSAPRARPPPRPPGSPSRPRRRRACRPPGRP